MEFKIYKIPNTGIKKIIVPTLFNLTPQLLESQLQHMKQNEIMCMNYIRLFSFIVF